MNKSEFTAKLKKKGVKNASDTYDAFINVIIDELKEGNDVTLSGIGILRVADKPAREGRNPGTGAKIQIPAKKALSLKVSKTIKDILNK